MSLWVQCGCKIDYTGLIYRMQRDAKCLIYKVSACFVRGLFDPPKGKVVSSNLAWDAIKACMTRQSRSGRLASWQALQG